MPSWFLLVLRCVSTQKMEKLRTDSVETTGEMVPYAAVGHQDSQGDSGTLVSSACHSLGGRRRPDAQWGLRTPLEQDRTANMTSPPGPQKLPGGPSRIWHPSDTGKTRTCIDLSGTLIMPGPPTLLPSLPRTLPHFGKLLFIL